MWFFQMIRLPNLLIMGATQLIVFYQVNMKALARGDIHVESVSLQLVILILGTMFIGAAGNIWNDFNDLQVDKINRPGKAHIGSKIGRSQAVYLVIVTAIAGILCGMILSIAMENLSLILIFIGTSFLLYYYSIDLKRKPLIGNCSIALLCCVVVGITSLILSEELIQLSGLDQHVFRSWSVSFAAFCCFSFLGTFTREMIKDLQDYEGDSLFGFQTFPVKTSIKSSKQLIRFMHILLFLLIAVWGIILFPNLTVPGLIYLAVMLTALIPLAYLLNHASDSADYRKVSLYWKYFFVFGLGFAFLLPW